MPLRAILDLKNQRDSLKRYSKRITVITSREQAIALQHLASNDRPRALLALRRKKYQETLLSKTDAQLAQLEALCADVDFALVQKSVVYGLQQGTAVLKEIHKEMGGLERVEKLMGEGEEQRAFQREVSEMLEGRMSVVEEEEVEEELAKMQARQDERLPQPPVGQVLPQAPTEELKRAERADQREEQREALPAS